tara:strand:+ start:153 stop:896 length:744 start_codon:yes stop_codon:yes gene_type:complete
MRQSFAWLHVTEPGCLKVLFVSRDHGNITELELALRLRWPDAASTVVSDGRRLIDALACEPEIVFVSGDLPDIGLMDILKVVRDVTDVPLIVADERGDESTVVKALQLGADEYIRLPRNMMEITARAMALMRRAGNGNPRSEDAEIRCGDLLINPSERAVYLGAARLELTPTEFRLLHLFAKNRYVTLSQGFIQRVVWEGEQDGAEGLKKYIQRLRNKLGDDARDPVWIRTVRGVGYRLTAPAPVAA